MNVQMKATLSDETLRDGDWRVHWTRIKAEEQDIRKYHREISHITFVGDVGPVDLNEARVEAALDDDYNLI